MKPATKKFRRSKLLSIILAASLSLNMTGMTAFAQPATEEAEVILAESAGTLDGTEDLSSGDVSDVTSGNVSDQQVSEGDVSGSDVSEGDMQAAPLFPGLGKNHVFSAEELEQKAILAEHVGDIPTEEENNISNAYVPSQIVYLTDSADEALAVADAFGATLESYFDGVAVIELSADRTVAQAVKAAADPSCMLPAVWPNYYRKLYATYNDPYLTENSSGYQWFHESVGDQYAWDAGYKGQGIKIGIIDSGVLNAHEDLSARVKQHLSMTGSVASAANSDPNGHGTHVSGIAAASVNNSKGGAGIAPEAGLYVYGVTDSDGVVVSSATQRAVNRAISDGVNVINVSLGGIDYDNNEATVFRNAYQAGIAVFAAAGNEHANTLSYPAGYKYVYSVGALQQDGKKAYFSNYNSDVDLAFPGYEIYSTYNTGKTGYKSDSGTSMACPVATGTAAVILSGANDITELKGKTGSKKVDALISIMKKNAIKASSSGMGAGTTYLPKVFGITPATADAVPAAPVFSAANKTVFTGTTAGVTISGAASGIAVYYSTDGTTPTYKNGTITNGQRYTTAITIGNAKTVTLKAIAVNLTTGKTSKVTSATYTFAPVPSSLTLTSANGCNSVVPGGSLTLKATVSPSYAIPVKTTWSVSPADQGVTVSASGKVSVSKTAKVGSYIVIASATTTDKTRAAVTRTGSFAFTVKNADAATIKSIALAKNNKSLSLIPGTTASLATGLSVTNKDGKAGSTSGLVWTSSDTTVATVTAAGVVTAKAVGKAEIRVAANDGSGKYAVCKLTVGAAVTSVTLSGPNKVLAGKSIALTAKVLPDKAANKTLEWSSSNAAVTVKNGKVTADKKLAAGTTVTITAKATDGSGKSASKTITIVSDTIKSITLNQKSLNLFAVKGYSNAPTTGTLKATVKGGNASSISYTSSAPGVATVNASGVVTAVSCGKAVITCAATDGSGKKATCTVNVSVPLSKLTIVAATENPGVVSIGTTVKLGTKVNTSFGKPANQKVTWRVADADKDKISVSSSGVVKALSLGSGATNSTLETTATVIAEAADGSGVKAEYTITVLRKIKSYGVSRSTYTFRPYVTFDNGKQVYISDYSVSVSSSKNLCSCSYDGTSFYVIPSKATTSLSRASLYARGYYLSGEAVNASVKVKFQTGGNKTISKSCGFIRTSDDYIISVK